MKKLKNVISLLLLTAMLFNAFALCTSAVSVTGEGTKFKSGFDNLYVSQKKAEALPMTYEATVYIPTSESDQFWGDIFAFYSTETNINYVIWDVQVTTNADLRFFCGKRDANGAIEAEVMLRFSDALKNYKGKTVHLAVTLDASLNMVKLYIDGTEWTGTQTYSKSGSGVASAAGLIDLYKSFDLSKLPNGTIGGDMRKKDLSSPYAIHHIDNNRFFRGKIYNVSLFSDVRSASEVASDVSALPDKADGILMCYDTSSAVQGKTITDISGNGYNLQKGTYKIDGMSFSPGFDSIYSADKKFTAMPKTFEAKILVPTSYGDQYWGNIFGWYNDTPNSHYAFWDIHAPSSTNVRFLCGIRNESNGIVSEIIVNFIGALNDYRGKTVDIAITFDDANKTVKLYIDGKEFTGTVTYTKTGNATASAEGLVTLYNSLEPAKLPPFVLGGDFRPSLPDSQYAVHHTDNWRYFRGNILQMSAFADVRTAAEIASDIQAMPEGDDKLVLWYDTAKAANASVIPDKSGNGYDLKGDPEWADTKIPVTDFAYSFAVVGDTQVITRDEAVTTANTYSPEYAGNLSKIYDWIMANKDSKNIQFSFHMGDVTDWSNAAEWELAMKHIHKMDGEIPYNIVRGNHDGGDAFVKNYTMDTFKANIVDGEEYGTFDGNTLNTYQTITVGNVKYLMLSLDLGPCKAVIDWANEVVRTHPFHNVIISTHSYLHHTGVYMDDPLDCSATQYNPGGKYNGGQHEDGNVYYWDYRLQKYKEGGDDYLYQDASYMWDNLVKKHKNICMVLCGHEISDQILNVEAVGDHGNKIAQILINPQGVDRRLQTADQGHAGLVAMLYFSEDGKTVTTEYYSTIRDQYYKEGLNNQTFTLDVITAPQNANELHEEIAKAEGLSEKDYSVEDWADIQAAISDAKTKLDLTDLEEIKAAIAALKAVVEGKTKIDRDALTALISKASEYKKEKYTETSWSVLEQKLTAANNVLESSRVQADIDTAFSELDAAIKALEEKKTENTTNKPDETEKPTDKPTEKPTEKPTDAKQTESTDKKDGKGCGSSIGACSVALVTVLALGACASLKKKRND